MEKPVITSSAILADLESGLTREEIRVKYDLNGVQLKKIFQSPSLKNKKTIKEKGSNFIFIDDLSGQDAPNTSDVSNVTNTPEAENQLELFPEGENSESQGEEAQAEEATAMMEQSGTIHV